MVALKNLALGNTGDYACEVSGEAPKFKTSAGAGKMMVIDLPDERPIIKVFPFPFFRQNQAWQFNVKSYAHYLIVFVLFCVGRQRKRLSRWSMA